MTNPMETSWKKPAAPEMEKPSLERAEELVAKYEKLKDKFGIASAIYEKMVDFYPELKKDKEEGVNAYAAYQADNQKLADQMGAAANAFDPENLKKMMGVQNQEQKDTDQASGVIDQSVIVAENLPGDLGGIQLPGESDEQEGVQQAQPTVAPAVSPKIEVAQPQPIATPEPVVATATEESEPNPVAAPAAAPSAAAVETAPAVTTTSSSETTSSTTETVETEKKYYEQGDPSLDRSRKDFTESFFKNKDAIQSDTLTPWDEAHVKSKQEKYDKALIEEHNRILKTEGYEAAVKFINDEKTKREREVLARQNKEDIDNIKKGIKKGIDTVAPAVAGVAGLATGAALYGKDLAQFVGRKAINAKQNVNWGKKFDELKEKFSKESKPVTLKGKLQEWAGIETEEDKKERLKKEKEAENKKLKEGAIKMRDNSKDEILPEDSLELKKEIPKKEKEALEKLFGEKLTEKEEKFWLRMRRVRAYSFFHPEKLFTTPFELKGVSKKIREKLDPLHEKDSPKQYDIEPNISIANYLLHLAKQEKLISEEKKEEKKREKAEESKEAEVPNSPT